MSLLFFTGISTNDCYTKEVLAIPSWIFPIWYGAFCNGGRGYFLTPLLLVGETFDWLMKPPHVYTIMMRLMMIHDANEQLKMLYCLVCWSLVYDYTHAMQATPPFPTR